MYKHLIITLLSVCLGNALFAQNQFSQISLSSYNQANFSLKDSTKHKKQRHINARASMVKSIILPGLGQAANHQFWKIPVLYAGFAVCAYSINFANEHYQDFKQAYIWRTDGNVNTVDKYDTNGTSSVYYNAAQLKVARDYYRRNLELSVIITTGVYLLNIIDAYVSAHLLNFDISDDLSIRFNVPVIYNYREKNILMNGFVLVF